MSECVLAALSYSEEGFFSIDFLILLRKRFQTKYVVLSYAIDVVSIISYYLGGWTCISRGMKMPLTTQDGYHITDDERASFDRSWEWFLCYWGFCLLETLAMITCYGLLQNVLIHHHVNYEELAASWWRHQMEYFPCNWPFVFGIHHSPVSSPHKGQWRGALMLSLICARINGWVNNGGWGDATVPIMTLL